MMSSGHTLGHATNAVSQANYFIETFFLLIEYILILILVMLCIDFVLFLKVQLLREFQNIKKFVLFWAKLQNTPQLICI